MSGDDWVSERGRKAQAKAEAARKRAALVCAKKLEAAAEALNDLMRACNDCGDGGRVKGIDDGRIRLVENLMEYASWLDSVYAK